MSCEDERGRRGALKAPNGQVANYPSQTLCYGVVEADVQVIAMFGGVANEPKHPLNTNPASISAILASAGWVGRIGGSVRA